MSKAQTTALITFIVAGIVVISFLAGWIYFFNTMTTSLQGVTIDTNIVNFSSAVANTVAPVNNSMNGLHLLSVCILLGLIMGMLIEAYYIRRHPILFVVHLLITILAVIASAYISNEYESLMSNSILGTIISENTAGSFIMLNLPVITTVLGFLGLILMFIAINRDPEHNGGTI